MSEAIYGLLRSSSSRHQPWQIAAALAMGVMCGMLPKFGFLFCLIGCGCVLLPIHLPLAAITCAAGSLAAMSAIPLAGRIGLWSLTHPWLSSFWSTLDALPFIPWLGLHNSVVNGSVLIGLGLWLPVFLASKPIARRLALRVSAAQTVGSDPDFGHELKPAVAVARKAPTPTAEPPIAVAWADSLPVFAELSGPGDHRHHAVLELDGKPANREPEHTVPLGRMPMDAERDPCSQLQQLLERCRSDDGSQLSVEQMVHRATQMAEFVDELLSACAAEDAPAEAAGDLKSPGDGATALPHIRNHSVEKLSDEHFSALAYSSQVGEEFSYMGPTPALPLFSDQTPTAHQRAASGPLVTGEGELFKRHQQHREPPSVAPPLPEAASRAAAGVERQQEALRYLLHHLKAFRDKV